MAVALHITQVGFFLCGLLSVHQEKASCFNLLIFSIGIRLFVTPLGFQECKWPNCTPSYTCISNDLRTLDSVFIKLISSNFQTWFLEAFLTCLSLWSHFPLHTLAFHFRHKGVPEECLSMHWFQVIIHDCGNMNGA